MKWSSMSLVKVLRCGNARSISPRADTRNFCQVEPEPSPFLYLEAEYHVQDAS